VLHTLAVENYRSLRHLVIPLGPLNVITGANGSGKSSLYRALRLLADASRNGAVAALAREGGLESTLWAGPDKLDRTEGVHSLHSAVRTGPGLRLGFAGDTGDFSYAIDLGKPIPDATSMFNSDPEIKCESIWSGPVLRPSAVLAERHNAIVRIRGADGSWTDEYQQIRPYDSMLSEFADPQRAPEVLRLRDLVRSWRFYDHVRTDNAAPARGSRVGTRTTVLGPDGDDLAAALQTIREIGDARALAAAVDLAFPGSKLRVTSDDAGRFDLWLSQPGLYRPLGATELSDGTLRYLLWVAVLLTPRPPQLLVLNEPETSLHPDLLAPLAQLIVTAAARSQLIVVSHSRPLITAMRKLAGSGRPDISVNTIELAKQSGQTLVVGQEPLDEPAWHWPQRLKNCARPSPHCPAEAARRRYGRDRLRDGGGGLLREPDGLVHVGQRAEAADVHVPVQQDRAERAGRHHRGQREPDSSAHHQHDEGGRRCRPRLDPEQGALADGALDGVVGRRQVGVGVGVHGQPGRRDELQDQQPRSLARAHDGPVRTVPADHGHLRCGSR
jgi:predicted ATPase